MSKAANPLKELHELGQSLWYDNIRRQLITSGELARLRDEGVYGVTSNPTIFEKAVSGSTDYDEALVRLVKAKRRPADILWDLMVEDIQAACDVFRPVYDASKGHDGFVSIEVSPAVARSTKRTVEMARDLWKSRFANHSNQLDDTNKVRRLRRDIARVKTLQGERTRAAEK